MKVFISGRYTPDGSHVKTFARTAEKIEAKGHTAVNPSALLPRDLPRSESIQECFKRIDGCDAVYFLPNWIFSVGAILEWLYTWYTRKPVLRNLSTMEVRLWMK